MFVCFVYCVVCRQRPLRRADYSFRGVLLIAREYVHDVETSTTVRPWPDLGCCATDTKT